MKTLLPIICILSLVITLKAKTEVRYLDSYIFFGQCKNSIIMARYNIQTKEIVNLLCPKGSYMQFFNRVGNGNIIDINKSINSVSIKHSDGFISKFENLKMLAPTLKIGKWIPRGYLIGQGGKNINFQLIANE